MFLTRQGLTRQCLTRQGLTRQCVSRQGLTRQGLTVKVYLDAICYALCGKVLEAGVLDGCPVKWLEYRQPASLPAMFGSAAAGVALLRQNMPHPVCGDPC